MRGVGKRNVAPRDGFPPFLSCLADLTLRQSLSENKLFVMRELRAIINNHGLVNACEEDPWW